ncbi:hypothetical protein Leryth_004510 [Lithospermum erythrorhizon]|uniref:non-specific serine/threonine protein kinase n=1 Tax=Lithospermum erythrorhizon TaxID=34254 RepID=A0AAV3Q2G8_LITER|nr:hypothetical protein Leryth_004510 [Lithospermum erythrorhizon]
MCCFVTSNAANDELNSLMAFKNHSIEFDSNRFLKDWEVSNSSNYCNWNGVICSDLGHVLELNFSSAGLVGNLHLSSLVESLPNLAHLDFRGNLFYGNLSFPSAYDQSCSLESLDISENNFSQPIEFGALMLNCNRLRHLNLSSNRYLDDLSNLEFHSCGSLTVLDLSHNNFKASKFPASLTNCDLLETFDVGHNDINLEIPGDLFGNLKSLKHLILSQNQFHGGIPLELANSSQFRVLDLSSNGLTGTIPSWVCSNTTEFSLEELVLSDNYLIGEVPSGLELCQKLMKINLSFNNLSGSIPLDIFMLPNLEELIMWANNLSGEIPEGICRNGKTSLKLLILNNNRIEGTLPKSIGNCTNLIWLSLSNNHLTGEIPEKIGNLLNVSILQLANNLFSGEIPPEIGKCKSLLWLDMSHNSLSGNIPPELSDQSGLIIPGALSENKFAFMRGTDGSICRGIGGGLVAMENIRQERLAGFPGTFSCQPYRVYSGMTISPFSQNGSMIYIDLSSNPLSGTIPEKFGSMSYLNILILEHNDLTGTIPSSLGKLTRLSILDISNNFLEGFIPGSFGGLSTLTEIDVSYNNLTGPIPQSGQMATFPASKYENNSGLCGLPLEVCSSIVGQQSPESNEEEELRDFSTDFLHAFVIGFFPCFFLVFVTLSSRMFLQYTRENWK